MDFTPDIMDTQFKTFIKKAPSAMALFDCEMRCVAASGSWLVDFHMNEKMVAGCSFNDLFKDDRGNWKEIYQQCLQGTHHQGTESQFKNPDGSIRWFSWSVMPWQNESGEIIGLTMASYDITKFKAREAEDEKLIEVLDRTNDIARIGTWEVNIMTGEIKWSKVTREIHEVGEDYVPQMDTAISFFKEGESREKVSAAVSKAIEHGTSYDIELELVTAKGNTVWARSIGYAEMENGKCVKLSGVFHDLTELKEFDRLINEERKLLKTVVDSIPLNIYLKDLESRKVLINKREREYMGVEDESEVIGKNDYELFPPESAAISIAEDQQIFKTGVGIEGLETYNFFDDDEGTWFVTSKIPLRNDQGVITGLLGIGFDITDRKLAESQVTKLLDELRAIMNATTEVAIIGSDLVGSITHFNKGAEHLLGYKADEVIGKSPLIFHEQSEIDGRRSELSKLMSREIPDSGLFIECAKQQPIAKEWTYIRKGGSSFPVQLVVTPIKNNEGEVLGALSIAADISERVKNRMQLLNAKADLEVLAENLTSKNTQLANFAHITSHNLRAPVSNLNSLLHIFNTSETEEDRAMIFKKFEKVIEHLSSTLNSLVEALKIKEETSQELTEVQFEDIFKKTAEILTAQISESKAEIATDFTAASGITYNATYLESIFLNLLTNALKYKDPDRAPRIEIKTSNFNGKIGLSIKDNGLGIDLEKHGHKLFGLNKTFHRHTEAKGVGLYITKTQVESMGGTIGAESEPGKGTTFTILFN